MSEDESRRTGQHEEEQDDVEAHRHLKSANEEGGDETESDDDFEAHRQQKNQVRPG